MRPQVNTLILLLLSLSIFSRSFGQKEVITADVEKDKPEKFQNKVLKSEKTGDKKFTFPRKVMQNTVTHYNYYFNASSKLEKVIDRAKASQRENYLKLLPFYPYSLNTTAAQKVELDSVIYKATAGILLHDLRNNWVDDLYLLIGVAYYLRKDFDSAGMTFQFINYNLAPKKKYDDDASLVGSNDNNNTTGFLSISNKEKKGFSLVKKPARNDAILWQAKTLIASGEYPEAAGLMNTLQNDPNFPSRLHKDLEELYGYLYYEQQAYDSAASHLERSFSSTSGRQENARKQFLTAQLYELSKQPLNAAKFYAKAANNTTDPLMDIYANLYNARILKGTQSNELDNNISNLLKLAKKGKFENFRDIVYYSAGELALQKPDTSLARVYFKKSIGVNINNASFKNRAFLQLANLEFANKHYKYASMYYDSIDVNDGALVNDQKFIVDRRKSLSGLVKYINIIEREDSLQALAKLPPNVRDQQIKKLLKQLRRAKGLKDEQNYVPPSAAFNSQNTTDIFGNTSSTDWYFDNPAEKSRGYGEFKNKWGKRENIDNWRRQKSASGVASARLNTNPDNVSDLSIVDNGVNPANPDISQSSNPLIPLDLTYDGMLANVPITDDRLRVSNNNLANAVFHLGDLYENSLEDYPLTLQLLQRSIKNYPDSLYQGQLYSDLYHAYEKTGNQAKANEYKNLLQNKFADTRYGQSVIHPIQLQPSEQNPAATASYDNIYNSFLEGNFDKALSEKRMADSLYGKTYWNPQLLYIEAVYHIKQQEDSQALAILNNISTLYPSSPLKIMADNLSQVLRRRKEIENYLTNLKVERENDSVVNNNIASRSLEVAEINDPTQPGYKGKSSKSRGQLTAPVKNNPVSNVSNPSASVSSVTTNSKNADKANVVTNIPLPTSFSIDKTAPQSVVMILDKVDPVYISEARNAFNRYNREKFSSLHITVEKDQLNPDKALLLFSPFADADAALDYRSKIKSDAPNEVSWLPGSKYSFIIISEPNLKLLKSNQAIQVYTELLKTTFPGKF